MVILFSGWSWCVFKYNTALCWLGAIQHFHSADTKLCEKNKLNTHTMIKLQSTKHKESPNLTVLLLMTIMLLHIKCVFITSFGVRFYIFYLLLRRLSHIFSYTLSPDGISCSLSSDFRIQLSIQFVKPHCSSLFFVHSIVGGNWIWRRWLDMDWATNIKNCASSTSWSGLWSFEALGVRTICLSDNFPRVSFPANTHCSASYLSYHDR